MTDLREAAQMALDALEEYEDGQKVYFDDEIEALRAALAQPDPEPVAWKDAPSKIYLQVCEESNCDQPFDSHIEISWCQDKINDSDISYVRADIAPPQREWQGLTENEIKHLWYEACQTNLELTSQLIVHLARNIEAKLKEKNT